MEHYLLLGLAALVIGLLLMSIGPRTATTSDPGGADFFAPNPEGNYSSKSQSPNTKAG